MSITSFFSKIFSSGEAAAPEQTSEASSAAPVEASPKDGENQQSFTREVLSPEEQQAKLKNIEDFVEYVVKALVDYPEEVKISNETTERQIVINVVCRPSDRGKIIGKKGKTIMALRSLVAGAAGRLQNRVTVEVLDDDEVKN